MKKLVLIFTLVTMVTVVFAQETATLTIARKKLYTGQMGPIKVFIDGKLVCQIDNNSYSVHQLPEGKHKIAVQWNGKELKENADDIEVDVKKGNQYFVKAFKEKRRLIDYLLVEEITASSWEKIKSDLTKDDCL